MSLYDWHIVVAWVVVIGNGLVGAWALAGHFFESVRHRALWIATGLAQITIFVQAGLGVALNNDEQYTAPDFHMFYGFVAIITVGLIYSYRPQVKPYQYALYGGGGLFLMGLGIRAMFLGAAG